MDKVRKLLSPLRVLLVEDTLADAALIKEALGQAAPQAVEITHMQTLEEALARLGEERFDAALLDLSLPDVMGFMGLLGIQNAAPALPVIILTAYADEALALKAVERGAQDYLLKDEVDGGEILRSLHYALQRKQFEGTLIRQANFDMLTGLANRTLFESRLEMALARARRAGSGVGMFFLDLDRFKQVNDTLGHAAGDLLLKEVAKRLKECLRSYDTVARFGGDEFALLVEGIQRSRDCAAFAQKIIDRIVEPALIAGEQVSVGISIGIATCGGAQALSADAMMRQADEAMYRAKAVPYSFYQFYTPQMHEEAQRRLQIEAELRDALRDNGLLLYYQPRLALDTGRIVGAEALIRWNHPERGVLLPAEFIAVAEETGMMPQLGRWVLDAVCRELVSWRRQGFGPIQVSVNLSSSQMDAPDFAAGLEALLEQYEISPRLLALELPETVLANCPPARREAISRLKEMGVALLVDRFGDGSASMRMLQALAPHALKLDAALAKALDPGRQAPPLIDALIALAHKLKLQVVAMGVESVWQQSYLKELGCDQLQGFVVSRPMPSDYLPQWNLSRHSPEISAK